MPGVLPVATLALLTNIIRNVRLFGDMNGMENRVTFTRCSEEVENCSLIIGGNSSGGLRASYTGRDHYDSDVEGVAIQLQI